MAPSLDSRKNNRNRSCGYMMATRTVVDGLQGYREFARIYCKRWSCPDCGPYLTWRFMSRLAVVAQENDLSRMLTLTLDPNTAPTDKMEAVAHLKGTWAKLRTYLKRKFKQTVSFVWVLEFHKSGLPHLHVLVDRFINQRWISANWSAIGGGRIVDIRRVKNVEKAGWYLSKYLSKDDILRVPKGIRRYGTSRDIKLFPKAETDGWGLVDSDIDQCYAVHQDQAEKVLTTKRGELQSYRLPVEVDDPHGYPVGYWRPYDPKRDVLPEELRNLPSWIRVIATSDEEVEEHHASSDLRPSVEQRTEGRGLQYPRAVGDAA